jgi:hypothetical protein
VERDKPKKIGIGRTNFAAVAMEINKGEFFFLFLSSNFMKQRRNIHRGVAKICEVWSEFNIFCTLVTMATAAILIYFSTPKAATHYSGYSYKVS